MDNQYERYLREQEEKQKGSSLLQKGITAGAIGGSAYLLYKNPTVVKSALTSGASYAGKGVSVFLQKTKAGEHLQRVGSVLGAIHDATQQRSLLGYLKTPGNFEARFKDSMSRRIDERIEQANSALGKQMTSIEKSISDYYIRSAGFSNKDSIRYTHAIEKQRDTVSKELGRKFGTEMPRDLVEILNQQSSDFFTAPNQKKIEALIEKYTTANAKKNNLEHTLDVPGDKKEEFIESMLGTLKQYQDTKSFAFTKEANEASRKLRQVILDDTKEKHTPKDDVITRAIRAVMEKDGFQNISVREALDDGLFEADIKKIHRYTQNGEAVVRNANYGSKIKKISAFDEEFLDLLIDPLIFRNKKTGEIRDLRKADDVVHKSISFAQDHFHIPFLRINPIDLMHWTTYQAKRESPLSYFMNRGTIQPTLQKAAETASKHPRAHNQDAAATPLQQKYMFSGDAVYDVLTGSKIKDNVWLSSARFGMVPREMASMANLHSRDYRNRSFLGRLFDLGAQEAPHAAGRIASMVTKFDDPNWEPNTYRLLRGKQGEDLEFVESAYKNIHSFLDTRATALSDDVVRHINGAVKDAYGDVDVDLLKLNTPEEIMDTLRRITNNIGQKTSGKAVETRTIDSMMFKMHDDYVKNADAFLNGKRILSDISPYMDGVFAAIDTSETQLISKVEDVKRLIHQHAIEQVEFTTKKTVTVQKMVKDGVLSGELDAAAIGQVRDLTALSGTRRHWSDVYLGTNDDKASALKQFQTEIAGDDTFTKAVFESIQSHSSAISMGPGDKPPQPFGPVGFMVVNKAKGYQTAIESFNQSISEGINPLKAMANSAWEIMGQAFAGRRNMDNVTTATLPFYYLAERLDNAMAKIGLGLSQENRGSMQSILLNQFGRRIVLPYAGLQQLQYFDGLTGDIVSDQLADTYVNMHEDTARVKNLLGLNQLGKYMSGLSPGGDLFWGTPIGSLLKHGSFGFFGDTRSGDEVREYYESGEDPIRRGRYWSIGSNTPWQGGKIDYYAPNWYRRMKSDYQFSENMYGSEAEYWRNHWMPTLTNPFAPLSHFVLDPDHYQEKHADDRPYPMKGGIEEIGMIPLAGPILNGTIGRVLNPQVVRGDLEKHHRAYLEEINNYYANQYGTYGSGTAIETMPAGGIRIAGSGSPSGDLGYYTGGVSGNGAGSVREQLTAINLGLASGASSPIPSVTGLDDLRDPNLVADLAGVSTSATLHNSWYGLTEMAGMYGFLTNTLLGWDERGGGPQFANASDMMSYSRRWWDLEMGGLGGDLSEIGRRYNPRDKGNYYNPIKNTMPDWLPGVDYFVDFQHGDPYTKVKRGEMRLPGEAYEKINKLHPDAIFGEYGAFDRFKILADVAPYSDQYRYYRGVVSQMKQNDLLSEEMNDEYDDVVEQVRSKKDKYNLYPRRFTNADVDKHDVTITRIIDQNTFMTKEFGNNPIRLAGVHIPKEAREAQEWLSNYIYEGAKVTIGVDADPLMRVRDDTMETIRAVVYSNGNDPDRTFYTSTKGQSVNGLLARRDFQSGRGVSNEVKVKDDGSAVSTAALYDTADITVGKTWEWFTHDVIPSIPIVNVVMDKFMQIKSPLEMYKEREVFGKSWQPWYAPISGWIKPMLDEAAESNPLVATAGGAGVGWLFGRSNASKYWGMRVGGAAFGTLAALRSADEYVGNKLDKGYTWIPKRREKEREIDEYFDILKYMKYRGLYERTRQEAIREEGVDIEELVSESSVRGKENKKQREYLKTMKKWLSINKDVGYLDTEFVEEHIMKNVNDRLKEIDGDRSTRQIGEKSMLALQYKNEYESTLYGANAYGDMTKIYKALPSKDREFFTHFMNAAPEEREEILRLVPENQRRFYQAKWGMDVDKKESLQQYFLGHHLPGKNWSGWRPDVNLDSIKLKVVENEGMEITEFGLWEDDKARAEQAGAKAININVPSQFLDVNRIEQVLRGAGLDDVSVTMSVAQGSGENQINTMMNIINDRSKDIMNELNNNLGSIF